MTCFCPSCIADRESESSLREIESAMRECIERGPGWLRWHRLKQAYETYQGRNLNVGEL